MAATTSSMESEEEWGPSKKATDASQAGEDVAHHPASTHNVNWTQENMVAAGLGLSAFLLMLATLAICLLVEGDAELASVYKNEVNHIVYVGPLAAFLTVALISALGMMVDRGNSKQFIHLVVLYISLLAACNDLVAFMDWGPILRDPWGQGTHITRWVLWLWSTPAIIYLISMLSDYSPFQIVLCCAMNAGVLIISIWAVVQTDMTFGAILMVVATLLFLYQAVLMWHMFDASLEAAHSETTRSNLAIVRFGTIILWTLFIAVWFVTKLQPFSLEVEEGVWCVLDFVGKALFPSSLLTSAFMTKDDRQLDAMRAVEKANRTLVIQKLRTLVDQKAQFISSMSHELRTPLNGIIGLSDALLIGSCGELSTNMAKNISTIKISGTRLVNLVNDILDAASMGKGTLIIKHEKLRLHALIQDMLDLAMPLVKKGVKLVNHCHISLPPVLGDSDRIMQILNNLVGNACKFTRSGTIWVSAVRKADEVEVSVTDTGIGIPEDKWGSIFEAFEQVDMSTTREYGGTGLGLNLVKQLVEAHGGTITLKSRLKQGSIFCFTLKVWQDSDEVEAERGRRSVEINKADQLKNDASVIETSPAASSAAAAAAMRARSTKLVSKEVLTPRALGLTIRVLSVDDDPINQLVIQSLLEPEGYEITQAMDGQEALELLQEMDTLPDIVLLDVMMPGLSGFQVCRKFRELYPDGPPVIMISAKSQEENIVEGLTSGANDYVVKPFGRVEILARIATHLRLRDPSYGLSHDSQTVPHGVLDSARSHTVSPQTTSTGGWSNAVAALGAQVAKLQHDKDVMERQMGKVTLEAGRLQDENDHLHFQIAAQDQAHVDAPLDSIQDQDEEILAAAPKVVEEPTQDVTATLLVEADAVASVCATDLDVSG